MYYSKRYRNYSDPGFVSMKKIKEGPASTRPSSLGGQSLIEVLIALALGALIVAAITAAVLAALNNAQYSKNQNLATQYAQEGMEVVRKIKTSDWATFDALNGQYCLDQNSSNLTSYGTGCGQNVYPFTRVVYIDESCGNSVAAQKKVSVWVFWSDSKCTNEDNPFCHKAQMVSCFSDANIITTP